MKRNKKLNVGMLNGQSCDYAVEARNVVEARKVRKSAIFLELFVFCCIVVSQVSFLRIILQRLGRCFRKPLLQIDGY